MKPNTQGQNSICFQNLSLPSWGGGKSGIDVTAYGGSIHTFFCTNDIILSELCEVLMYSNAPVSGRILYNGVHLRDNRSRTCARMQAVLKRENLFEDLNVAENIFLPQKDAFFINRVKNKRECQRLMTQMDAGLEWMNRPVKALSSEARKLVELFRCYVSRPDIVILHETLSYLSRDGIQVWNQMIQRMHDAGVIILYLTSRIEETVYLADAVTVLTQSGSKGNFSSEQMQSDLPNIYHLMLDDEGFMSYYADRSAPEKNLLEIIEESSKFIYQGHGINNALHMFAHKIQQSLNAVSCTILLVDKRTEKIIDRVDCYQEEHPEWQLNEETLLERVDFRDDTNSLYCVNCKMADFESCFKQTGNAWVLFCYGGGLPSHIKTLITTVYDRDCIYSGDEVRFLSAVVKELAIILENSRLANRSALLFESHHRIKNNLQMVISLLLIQKMMITNEYNKRGEVPFDFYLQNIDDLFYRIKSIAMIHDMMSKEERSEGMASLDEIVRRICEFYRDAAVSHAEIEDIGVPYNISTSIALVVNELISNSIKHAVPGDRVEIKVRIRREIDNVLLEVSDNGPGFSEPETSAKESGIGIKLISGIINNELHGNMRMYNDGGAHVRVTIPTCILL